MDEVRVAWETFCKAVPRERIAAIRSIRHSTGLGIRDARDVFDNGVSHTQWALDNPIDSPMVEGMPLPDQLG